MPATAAATTSRHGYQHQQQTRFDAAMMMQGLQLHHGSATVAGPGLPPIAPSQKQQVPSVGGGVGNGGEPNFYHYCYVCNTQLNSCKQALLHCSGKRHRKKLHFLQSRKQTIGPRSTGQPPLPPSASGDPAGHLAAHRVYPNASFPVPPTALNYAPQPQHAHHGYAAHHHNAHHQPDIRPHFGGLSLDDSRQQYPSPPFFPFVHQQPHHQHSSTYFPAHQHQQQQASSSSPPVLSPSVMAGTEHWLHPPPFGLTVASLRTATAARHHHDAANLLPPAMLHHPTSSSFTGDAPAPLYNQRRPPAAWTGGSAGGPNGSGCYPSSRPTGYVPPRPTVMSPSDTSSMSSDPSSSVFVDPMRAVGEGDGYRCHVCGRQYSTGALLHSHLQTAKHFKHHQHHHSAAASGADRSGGAITAKGDSSETDSTSSLMNHCAVCSIAVNSPAQLQSHHAGQKHRQRANHSKQRVSTTSAVTQQQSNSGGGGSRSSTSPEPTPLDDERSTSSKDDDDDVEHAGDVTDDGNTAGVTGVVLVKPGGVTVTSTTNAATVESGYASASGDETSRIIRLAAAAAAGKSSSAGEGHAEFTASSSDGGATAFKCHLCDVVMATTVQAAQKSGAHTQLLQLSSLPAATTSLERCRSDDDEDDTASVTTLRAVDSQ